MARAVPQSAAIPIMSLSVFGALSLAEESIDVRQRAKDVGRCASVYVLTECLLAGEVALPVLLTLPPWRQQWS